MSRTFRSGWEDRRAVIGRLVDAARVVVVHANPLKAQQEDGSTSTQIGFPVLVVTDLVDKPEELGAKVAELLTEHMAASSAARRPFWVSWYAQSGSFELNSPWWITGCADHDGQTRDIICAAVLALDDADVRRQIAATHDEQTEPWFRFIEPRADDWSPFSKRFPKADWMVWPPAPIGGEDGQR